MGLLLQHGLFPAGEGLQAHQVHDGGSHVGQTEGVAFLQLVTLGGIVHDEGNGIQAVRGTGSQSRG